MCTTRSLCICWACQHAGVRMQTQHAARMRCLPAYTRAHARTRTHAHTHTRTHTHIHTHTLTNTGEAHSTHTQRTAHARAILCPPLQAELVTSLLSRLVPVWAELGPTQGEGLRHALFRLALALCCLDTKSASPIIKCVAAAGAPCACTAERGRGRVCMWEHVHPCMHAWW